MHTTSSIGFKNFGISFGTRVVLIDTSLQLSDTGVEVLVGPSASEKSLLLSSLAGLHSSSTSYKHWGEFYISGKLVDINSQDSSSRPILVRPVISELNHTVESLILSHYRPAKNHSINRQEFLNKLMVDYGLEDLLPLLKHQIVDIQIVWQRIVFAFIAAAKNPPMLMLDEPTKGLKLKEATLLMRFIRHLGKQLKILIALRSLAEAREVADQIILLAGGRVHFHGKSDDFFAKTSSSDIVKEFLQTGNISLAESKTNSNSLSNSDAVLKSSHATIVNAESIASKKENSKPVNYSEMNLIVEHNSIQSQHKESVTKSPEKLEFDTQEELIPTIQSAALLNPSKQGSYLVADVGLHKSNDLPAPNGFCWIVPSVLAACPTPGISESMGYDLDSLASLGITKLLTLNEEDLYQAELEAAGLSSEHLPMLNSDMPSIMQMHMLLLRMQKLIEDFEVLAVHCLDGLGKTGVVIAAWMIKEGRMSSGEALEKLRQINPGFVQNSAQETFLLKFEHDTLRRLK